MNYHPFCLPFEEVITVSHRSAERLLREKPFCSFGQETQFSSSSIFGQLQKHKAKLSKGWHVLLIAFQLCPLAMFLEIIWHWNEFLQVGSLTMEVVRVLEFYSSLRFELNDDMLESYKVIPLQRSAGLDC